MTIHIKMIFFGFFSFDSFQIFTSIRKGLNNWLKFNFKNKDFVINLSKGILSNIIIPPKSFQTISKLTCQEMQFNGHISLIYGPMFSGKSSELLRKIRRYEHAKKNCVVINYTHDNRYSSEDVMATHDKITHKALKASKLAEIKQQAQMYDVVGIDQGQFFEDIVQFAQDLANRGIVVIIAALDSTFQRKPFGNIINLVPLAEKVYKLTAVCVFCTQSAAFTLRTVESNEIQLIGGQQSYKPVCRQCFNNPPYLKSPKNFTKQQNVVQEESKQKIDLSEQHIQVTNFKNIIIV